MRKARDERVRITSAYFRISVDEEKDDESEDFSVQKLEEKLSQISSSSSSSSDSESRKLQKKASITKPEISSNLTAPDPESSDSTLCLSERLSATPRDTTFLKNAVDHAISETNATEKNYTKNSDVLLNIQMRRLAVPTTNLDQALSTLKCEDLIAKDSSTRLQSSLEDQSITRPKSITMDATKCSQLTSSLLEASAEESFGFNKHLLHPDLDKCLTLSKRSNAVKEKQQSCSSMKKESDIIPGSSTAIIQEKTDDKSAKSSSRRLTLPMMNMSQSTYDKNIETSTTTGTPTFEDILAGTSVNPIRKFSIANAAICSSLAPSLLGAIPGVPNSLLPNGNDRDSNLQRSATLSNLSTTSSAISDDTFNGRSGHRLKLPFLRLHLPEQQPSATWHNDDDCHLHQHDNNNHHHHHHVFPHIHVPTITFTAPATDGSGRKFNFAIRRHSQAVSALWLHVVLSLFFIFFFIFFFHSLLLTSLNRIIESKSG